jgi:hypothetical protein
MVYASASRGARVMHSTRSSCSIRRAWAALAALIDKCPAIHAALEAPRLSRLTINPTAFEFIARNSQIAAVREFMESLPSALAH